MGSDYENISAPYIDEQLNNYKKQKDAEARLQAEEYEWIHQMGNYQPPLFNITEDGNIEPI